MRDAMVAGVTLNIFNNHCDRVKMANLAQMVNVLQAVVLTHQQKIIRTPTYHVMEMFNVHQDATLLPLQITSNNYQFGNQTLPALSASASKDKEGAIHISIVNIDAKQTQNLTLSFSNTHLQNIKGRILTAEKLQHYNSFEQPDLIQPANFTQFKTSGNEIKITIPPFSVIVLAIPPQ
jgi:alpha-N-arabinofuranosidase